VVALGRKRLAEQWNFYIHWPSRTVFVTGFVRLSYRLHGKLTAKNISFNYEIASRMKKHVAVVLAFAENA
jgi:hypothetical protein